MNIIFYSTNCPKCNVLKTKLDAKGLSYTENNNVEEMLSLGLHNAPALKVDDQPVMEFFEAVKWINALEETSGDN